MISLYKNKAFEPLLGEAELNWSIDQLVYLADQPFICEESIDTIADSNLLNINLLRALKIVIDR